MKLVLRTTKKEGRYPLYTRINIEGDATWICMRIKVDVKEWKEASQSERKLANYLNKKGISKKVALIEDAIREMRLYHRLNKENLEQAIENIVLADKREELKRAELLKKEIEAKTKNSVRNYIINYVHRAQTGEILTDKRERFPKGTIKVLKQFQRVFLGYYDKRPFRWEDIDQNIVDGFINYCERLGYMKGTYDRYVSQFRTIVIAAEREKVHENHIARGMIKRPIVRDSDKAKEIYLTKDELQALYDMPLEGFDDVCRSVFLIGCYTGQRFSDYTSIDSSCIGYTAKKTKVIRLVQKKTRTEVVIPVMDEKLEALLKKFDYNVPNLIDVSLNRAIKRICHKLSETVPSLAKKERTKLTKKEREDEMKARAKGKELFEYDEQGFPVKPRWELVSSHTARRSAITNMVLSNKYTRPQMMSVSGHKTEKTFNDYIKLGLDEWADNIASSSKDGLF